MQRRPPRSKNLGEDHQDDMSVHGLILDLISVGFPNTLSRPGWGSKTESPGPPSRVLKRNDGQGSATTPRHTPGVVLRDKKEETRSYERSTLKGVGHHRGAPRALQTNRGNVPAVSTEQGSSDQECNTVRTTEKWTPKLSVTTRSRPRR